MNLSAITGKAIPQGAAAGAGPRRRRHDRLPGLDSRQAVALYGDPDHVFGITQFLLEMGAEPVHIVVTNSNEDFEAELREVLTNSPYGQEATIWPKKDLWHLRS
jgi:nitrogenase molybdenum-iron protein beta chain